MTYCKYLYSIVRPYDKQILLWIQKGRTFYKENAAITDIGVYNITGATKNENSYAEGFVCKVV